MICKSTPFTSKIKNPFHLFERVQFGQFWGKTTTHVRKSHLALFYSPRVVRIHLPVVQILSGQPTRFRWIEWSSWIAFYGFPPLMLAFLPATCYGALCTILRSVTGLSLEALHFLFIKRAHHTCFQLWIAFSETTSFIDQGPFHFWPLISNLPLLLFSCSTSQYYCAMYLENILWCNGLSFGEPMSCQKLVFELPGIYLALR